MKWSFGIKIIFYWKCMVKWFGIDSSAIIQVPILFYQIINKIPQNMTRSKKKCYFILCMLIPINWERFNVNIIFIIIIVTLMLRYISNRPILMGLVIIQSKNLNVWFSFIIWANMIKHYFKKYSIRIQPFLVITQ